MNYTGTMAAEKVMCEAVCEPINTMNNRINETMGMLKELLMAMDDTAIVLFGRPIDSPAKTEMPQEAKCMDDALNIVEEQARIAMARFMEMRKRLV